MQEDDNLPNAAQAAEGAQAADENQSDETTEDEQESEGSETETGDEGDEPSDGETDEAEGDEADADDEDKGEAKPKKPSRSERYKRQIERLNAELRARDQGGPRGGLTDDAVAAKVETIIGKKPDQKDFGDDYIGFERAVNAYEVDKRLTTREVKKQGETQAAAQAEMRREMQEDHLERVEDFRKTAKDFDKVLKSAADSKLGANATVEDLVLESDKSAHLVYFLAKNPGQLDKLNAMTEREAAREIGRIESRLSLPSPKTQTQAPKPVKPLKGGAAPQSQDAALDAWMKKTYG